MKIRIVAWIWFVLVALMATRSVAPSVHEHGHESECVVCPLANPPRRPEQASASSHRNATSAGSPPDLVVARRVEELDVSIEASTVRYTGSGEAPLREDFRAPRVLWLATASPRGPPSLS